VVKHIHFHAWEDFDVPSNKSLFNLMSILNAQADFLMEEHVKMQVNDKYKPKKMLAHCLAGRGRTGTALSIINALITVKCQMAKLGNADADTIQQKVSLSIFSIVRRLRMQRATCVQASEQYEFI